MDTNLPVFSLAGTFLESWIRRGNPFLSGYEGNRGFHDVMPYSGRPGFSYPLVLGVLSILFSFGKGLLFFTPGLLLSRSALRELPARAPVARLLQLLLLFVAGTVLVYAKWWAWYGGGFWGPRFFLIASVPASLALAVHLSKPNRVLVMNCIVLGILFFSVWVSIDGALYGLSGLEKYMGEHGLAPESLTWYAPEFSPLWYPLIERHPFTAADSALVAYCLAVTVWLAFPTTKQVIGELNSQRFSAIFRTPIMD